MFSKLCFKLTKNMLPFHNVAQSNSHDLYARRQSTIFLKRNTDPGEDTDCNYDERILEQQMLTVVTNTSLPETMVFLYDRHYMNEYDFYINNYGFEEDDYSEVIQTDIVRYEYLPSREIPEFVTLNSNMNTIWKKIFKWIKKKSRCN